MRGWHIKGQSHNTTKAIRTITRTHRPGAEICHIKGDDIQGSIKSITTSDSTPTLPPSQTPRSISIPQLGTVARTEFRIIHNKRRTHAFPQTFSLLLHQIIVPETKFMPQHPWAGRPSRPCPGGRPGSDPHRRSWRPVRAGRRSRPRRWIRPRQRRGRSQR